MSKQWCNLSKRSWGDVKTLRTAAVSAEFKTKKQKRLSGDILASLMSRVTPALTCLDISGYQTREDYVSEDLISALGEQQWCRIKSALVTCVIVQNCPLIGTAHKIKITSWKIERGVGGVISTILVKEIY